MDKKKYKIIIGLMVIVIIGIMIYEHTELGKIITFDNFMKNKEKLHYYVQKNYIGTVIIYILAYAIISFGIPGAAILALVGGFIFGTTKGTIYINIGATIGATASFLLSRYIIGSWIQSQYKDKIIRINKQIKENGANYFLTARFIPIVPFFLINLLGGLTTIPLRTFIWTTSLGIIPVDIVYAYAGSNIENIHSLNDVLSTKVILTLSLLAIVPMLSSSLKKAME